MNEAPPIDYAHVHKLYSWCASSKGGGWFFVPTPIFACVCIVSAILLCFFHHWLLVIGVVWGFGAWEKRQGIREGFVLGYEAGHDECVVGKKTLPS